MATTFFCTDCGFESTKWSGKCPSCGSWSTMKESTRVTGKASKGGASDLQAPKPERIKDLKYSGETRSATGVREFDLVIGGGIVGGMLALIGGEPGIGKSTLMLQLSEWMGKQSKKVLYVSGEESAEQIHLRSTRLNIGSENIWLLCTNDAELMLKAAEESRPDIMIVDSIQSVSLPSLDSLPGSITQLRETSNRILRSAKILRMPVFMVGHVTKEGFVAGPKIIEHMVDTVLYFEGGGAHPYRVLRAHKNRFGSASEIGVFEMKAGGLAEVPNPSALFLAERPLDAPGSAVAAPCSPEPSPIGVSYPTQTAAT